MFIAMAVSITTVAPNIAITVVPVTVLSVGIAAIIPGFIANNPGTDLMVDAILS